MKTISKTLPCLCLFLLLTPTAQAQSNSWSYFNKAKKTTAPSTATEELSFEQQEKRKLENAALSSKLGITVPELFDQKLLSPSGTAPKTADDLKNIRKIKQAEGQQSLDKKRASIKQKKAEAAKRKKFLSKKKNRTNKYNYKKKNIYRAAPKRKKAFKPYSFGN